MFIIACGLPFRIVAMPVFRKMCEIIASMGSYKPPTPAAVAGKLLTSAKRKVDSDLVPLRSSYVKYGFSVCSDGWSDRRSRYADQDNWSLNRSGVGLCFVLLLSSFELFSYELFSFRFASFRLSLQVFV